MVTFFNIIISLGFNCEDIIRQLRVSEHIKIFSNINFRIDLLFHIKILVLKSQEFLNFFSLKI